MKRLDRYLALRWLALFLPAAAVLSAVYLSGDAAFLVWDLAARGVPAGAIALHFLLKLPGILYQTAPVAALLATLICLTGLKRRGELGAFLSSGVSGARVARPLLGCALLVSALSYHVDDALAPPANRLSRDIVRGEGASPLVVGTSRIWLLEGTRVVFISSVEDEGVTLIQPTVLEFTGQGLAFLSRRLDAPSARWEDGRWVAEGGIERTFRGDALAGRTEPARMLLPISIRPKEFFRARRTPEEMSRAELERYVENLRSAGLPFGRYAVRIHRKGAAAALPLVFTVLAVPVAFLVPRRGGAALAVGLSLLVAVLFWSLFNLVLSLGNNGVLPSAFAAWSVVALFLAVGLAALAATRRVRLT